MIDHVAAVVIGVVILFMVFALSARANDSAVEATQVDLAKADLRSLVDVFEQDFTNMGSGLGKANGSAAQRAVAERSSASGWETVRFYALPSETATSTQLVTWRWRQNGTVTVPDASGGTTTVPQFEIERVIGTGTSAQTAAFEKLVDFDLVLRYDELNPISPTAYSNADSLALIRYVDVELALVSPAGADGLVQETRWAKRYRPINLEPASRRIIASPP